METKRSIVNELHKPLRHNFPRRKVIVKGFNDLFQADLVDLKKLSKENKDVKYLLTVIDCFTKKAWAKPLMSKKGGEVSIAMESILKTLDKPPKFLCHDAGKEFNNRVFKNLMKKYGITNYNAYSDLKAQTVERFNRTLKEKMWREFNVRGSYDYLSFLETLLNDYNNKIHRSTGLPPNEVNESNRYDVMKKIYNLPPQKKRKNSTFYKKKALFKLNTLVRVSKNRSVFEKGYLPSYSTELFKISKVKQTNPPTYVLKDLDGNEIDGSFYSYELQVTKHPNEYLVEKIISRKGDKVRVKWLGFENPTWINSSDLLD